LGVWSEEIDALYDGESNTMVFNKDNELGIEGNYKLIELCDLIHAEGAETIGTYSKDFYAGRPALTVNRLGEGKAYYIAARTEEDFNNAFYSKLTKQLNINKSIDAELPEGVNAQRRTDGISNYIFLMNFTSEEKVVEMNNCNYRNLFTDKQIEEKILLKPYGIEILKEDLE
jgi:beta-galactosidase